MSSLIGSVSLTSGNGVYLGKVSLSNGNLENGQIPISNGEALIGNNELTYNNKLHVGPNLGFTNTYDTNLEAVTDYNGSSNNILCQNKNSGAVASTNIYLTNDGTIDQSSNYGVLGMNGSMYTGSATVGDRHDDLYLASTNGNVAIGVNYLGSGAGIHFSGNTTSSISINENNALSVYTTLSSNVYNYVCGLPGQVLTSQGASSNPTWETPSSGGVSVSNQSNTYIPYCTSASNSLVASSGLAFDVASNTLSTVNITCTNINGNPPTQITANANNRILTGITATNNAHANQDLTFDSNCLAIFANNASSNIAVWHGSSKLDSNLCIGNKTGNSLSTGLRNTCVGYTAGSSLANHINNTFVGFSDNTITGSASNLTSNNCTFVGANNLCFSNTTSNATILGVGNSKAGSSCILIGTNCRGMQNSNNVVIGSNSGAQVGSNDTIILGSGNHTSNYSSAVNADLVIGNNSMRSSSGGYNTAIGGGYAILDSITGTRNIGIGHAAGQLATTGNDNIFIGCLSAQNQNVINSNCIVIGNYSQLSSNAASNECVIGSSILSTFRIPGIGLNATSTQFKTTGHYAGSIPVTITADTTVADSTFWLINNKSGSTCVLTLPSAATWPGRILNIQNYQAQLVNSVSSNIVPMGGGAAGTAILSAVVGSWITLVSDGTNWIAMKT